MALVINGNKFSGILTEQLLATIITEIMRLPQPEVVPLIDQPVIDDAAFGLCLQREYIYVDTSRPTNPIKYIGSKDVQDCILLYVHSEIDHLAVHVDNVKELELEQRISKFKQKNNIKASILGGRPGHSQSKDNLRTIVSKLFHIAKQLDITIDFQKVNEQNAINENARFEFIYNYVMLDNANILYLRQFGEMLDFNAIRQQYPPAKLKKTLINFINANEEELFQLFCLNLLCAGFVDYACDVKGNEISATLLNIVKNKELFHKLLSCVFSINGYQLMDEVLKSRKGYPTNCLADFAIEVSTGKVYSIYKHINTLFEDERYLTTIDKPKYNDCYDPIRGTYIRPDMPHAIIEQSDFVLRRIKEKNLKREDVNSYVYPDPAFDKGIFNIRVQHHCAMAIARQQQLISSNSFFAPLNHEYVDHPNHHTILGLLAQLSGKPFIGKVRNSPLPSLDAHFYSREMKEVMQVYLDLKISDINAHTFRYRGQYCVCVSEINNPDTYVVIERAVKNQILAVKNRQ